MSEQSSVRVELSLVFKRNLRALSKKYRSIRKDIQLIIEQLKQGELLGTQISGVDRAVFKLRIRNSDLQRGKSGGYRLIYYVKTKKGIVLLTIYAKSEQVDIADAEIIRIITEYEKSTEGS